MRGPHYSNYPMNILTRVLGSRCYIGTGQKGISGLETAIILIAFVVISSVFAFAAMSTGMFSSDKARETASAGLSETRGTMEVKGSIIGTASTTGTTANIATITLDVTQGAGGGKVDMTPGTMVIKYTDKNQSKFFSSTSGFTVAGIGCADSDNLLENNEVYRVQLINLNTGFNASADDTLASALSANTTFTLEVIPIKGATLHIERTTPIFIDAINFLK